MIQDNIEKIGKNSIHAVNGAIVASIVAFNIAILIGIWSITEKEKAVTALVGVGIFMGTSLSIAYYYFNKRFASDFEAILGTMRNFLQNKDIRPTFSEPIFIENKRLESLFKQAYVRNGIMKKDFNDLNSIFKKFIPQDIYRQIGFKGYERITLGNCLPKNLTVMFLDIVGFTTISEKISPERTLLLLNIYFDGIGQIVHEHGGYIDKFLGDGIMIIFEQAESDESILCAMEIQEYIKKFQISALGKQLDIGIGINTGEVIMGTIGTKNRMDATVIGDNVNVASRIQSLTRQLKKNILISEKTYENVKDKKKFAFESMGKESVKGKEEQVTLYAVREYYNVEI